MNQDDIRRLDALITGLEVAEEAAKPAHISGVLNAAQPMLASEEGMAHMFERVGNIERAGIFHASPWEHPDRLVATLVGGTLRVGGPTTTLEVFSELRMLSYVTGQSTHSRISPEEAKDFLELVLTHNLDLIFPGSSEADRELGPEVRNVLRRLFDLVLSHIPLDGVKQKLAEEVEMISAQRPISTQRARRILQLVRDEMNLDRRRGDDRRLARYIDALYAPSARVADASTPEVYAKSLGTLDRAALLEECGALGESVRRTGLVNQAHPVLIKRVSEDLDLLATALDLNEAGQAELGTHHEFVRELIGHIMVPINARAVFGLARLLERGLLSRGPVFRSLKRMVDLDLHADVSEIILQSARADGDVPANILLLADTVNVLGQPLGVAQGWSPTCQSARGISLWSQHAPGTLMELLITVAQSNSLSMRFEGQMLSSSGLPEGLMDKLDDSLDAVSAVLVPHLDRIYGEMMRRAAYRGDDPHKWVNPSLYGHWIPTGFLSALNALTQDVGDYRTFIDTFYRLYHPEYNEGRDPIFPNPVGLFVTSSRGQPLGFHAITLLRAAPSPGGEVRCYFLNPNEEGRQDWGAGVVPTVSDHGERPGESSLPFDQMLSRLYAFHYNPTDLSEIRQVDDETVEAITKMARESWGQAYPWASAPMIPVGAGVAV